MSAEGPTDGRDGMAVDQEANDKPKMSVADMAQAALLAAFEDQDTLETGESWFVYLGEGAIERILRPGGDQAEDEARVLDRQTLFRKISIAFGLREAHMLNFRSVRTKVIGRKERYVWLLEIRFNATEDGNEAAKWLNIEPSQEDEQVAWEHGVQWNPDPRVEGGITELSV